MKVDGASWITSFRNHNTHTHTHAESFSVRRQEITSILRSSFASFRQNMMSVMRMNMAAVSTITLLLLCCSVFASQGSQDSCDVYAETNKDFNVPLNHKLKKTERLKWKFNGDTVFDRDGSNYIDGKEGDVTAEGLLVIKKASTKNNGMYTPEVYDQNGKLVPNLKSIRLCVIDPPPTPTVKVECVQSTKNVKFTCTVAKVGENFIITWQKNAEVLKKETKSHLMYKAETVENDEFRCNVSNPVGQTSSAPAKQHCHTSGFVFPEELWGINTWILVGIGGGVVVLLIIIIIVCCVCNRRKKRMQIKDEEELRLGWTNTQQQHPHQHNHPPHQHQHQHHHHHHHQQQPAGHTGPRQHRSRQQRNHPLPRTPDQANGQPQPSPRRPAQAPTPANNCDEEQPPPLPQPRKKAPKTPRA